MQCGYVSRKRRDELHTRILTNVQHMNITERLSLQRHACLKCRQSTDAREVHSIQQQ
jgi:hypothetical protein